MFASYVCLYSTRRLADEGLLEVVGNLGTMLSAAQGQRAGAIAVGKFGCGGSQPLIPTALYVVAA